MIQDSSFEDPFSVPYFPAPQSQQTEEEEPPTVVENLPWSHSWHVLLDNALVLEEYVPATHGEQAKIFDWPVSVLYKPAEQDLHWEKALAPISFPYVPAEHAWQLDSPTVSW